MELTEYKEVYEYKYDYDDIKIAICVQDFIDHNSDKFFPLTYEEIAKVVIDIKNKWKEYQKKGLLSEEEYTYIQKFAYNYLKENYGGNL